MKTVIRGRLAWVDKTDMDPEAIAQLRETFTLFPEKAGDYGGEESVVYAYEENTQYFGFPRQAVDIVFGKDVSVRDETSLGSPTKFTIKKKPWSAQIPLVEKAVEAIKSKGGTIISSPCGSGKTNMGLYVAAALEQPTLVLVPTTVIQKQWVDRAKEVLGVSAGIVQQDRCEFEKKKISIGMVHSVAARNYPEEFYAHFGLILVDECHRLGCETYDKAIRRFPSRYRCGLSATPRRKDGLEHLFYWHLGSVDALADKKSVEGKVYQFQLKSGINMHRFEYGKIKKRLNFSRMITALTQIEGRQDFLVKELGKMIEAGRKVLVLSDRKDQLKDFEKKIKSNKNFSSASVGYYVGGMSGKDLKKSAQGDIVLGTYQMAGEGMDVPALDTVILATPKSDIEQSVGRILREADGKKDPLVIDVVDFTPILIAMGRKRAKQYVELGFTIDKV